MVRYVSRGGEIDWSLVATGLVKVDGDLLDGTKLTEVVAGSQCLLDGYGLGQTDYVYHVSFNDAQVAVLGGPRRLGGGGACEETSDEFVCVSWIITLIVKRAEVVAGQNDYKIVSVADNKGR